MAIPNYETLMLPILHFLSEGDVKKTREIIHMIIREFKITPEETKELILKMKHRPGGFIVMPACVLTAAVPPANITAMVEATEDYGWYE